MKKTSHKFSLSRTLNSSARMNRINNVRKLRRLGQTCRHIILRQGVLEVLQYRADGGHLQSTKERFESRQGSMSADVPIMIE